MNISHGQASSSKDAIYKKIMPSMFHRRVFIFAILSILLFGGLAGQLIYLTTVNAESGQKMAEGMLIKSQYVATSRGSIYDRNGKLLAKDIPSYDLSVHFQLLNTRWASIWAMTKAKDTIGKTRWYQLDAEQRQRESQKYQPEYQQQVDTLWEELGEKSGQSLEELQTLKNDVLRRVQQIGAAVSKQKYDKLRKEIGKDIDFSKAITEVREEKNYYPILRNLSSQDMIRIKQKIANAADDSVWSRVRAVPSKHRIYPEEEIDLSVDRDTFPKAMRSKIPMLMKVQGVGFRIIGRMTAALKEDFDRKPFSRNTHELDGYRTGDQKGIWGLEQTQENILRGKRGYITKDLNSGENKTVVPIKGQNVKTTIDIVLQARIQALMDPEIGLMVKQPWHANKHLADGHVLNGAAVVLDIETSEVLAAVSVPGISRLQLKEDPNSVFNYSGESLGHTEEERQPYLFRPTQKSYAPGSIVKPLVMNMAVADQKIGAHDHIKCTGYFGKDPTAMRCWIYKQYHGATHESLGPSEALQRSCNIYFYELGRRLGPHRIIEWFEKFGLHQADYKTGLPRDHRGNLPAVLVDGVKAKLHSSIGVFMGIGQGPIDWTPLHAASAYAALARGGKYISPTFIMGENNKNRIVRDLKLNPQAVKNALKGLYDGANKRGGTTFQLRNTDASNSEGGLERIFNIKGVRVMAKSGTATADNRYRYDKNKDGVIDNRDPIEPRDHGWVVAMVQKPGSTRPDYVVAVVVEYGGSGGKVAGPIVNQILHAMQAQGYLPYAK